MFGSNSSGNIKAQGVRGNAHLLTSPSQGEPKQLLNVVAMEMFGVEFVDGEGQKHISTVVRAGNELFWAPNAEEWTSKLRPAAPWFKEAFVVRVGVAGASTEIPKTDTVDVMSAMLPPGAPTEKA